MNTMNRFVNVVCNHSYQPKDRVCRLLRAISKSRGSNRLGIGRYPRGDGISLMHLGHCSASQLFGIAQYSRLYKTMINGIPKD